MKLNFLQDALVIPGAVLSCGGAELTDLRVLLWLASDLSLSQKPKQLAKLCDSDVETVERSIRYWIDRGVLTCEDGESAAPVQTEKKPEKKDSKKDARKDGEKKEKTAKKLLRRADELPNYTSVELAELLEKRANVRALVDEAQQIVGKMFNPSEINILVGLYDYLGLSDESILLLFAYCKRIGKANLRSIEKYAHTLVERDITTPAALEEEFRALETLHSFEGQVRRLFGMKDRALSGKEAKMLRTWLEYGYDAEAVRRAYEITVNATNQPSVPYANSILERWHADGLRTAEEIDRYLQEQQAQKNAKNAPTLGNSFDTDDFFEAALKRSFSGMED